MRLSKSSRLLHNAGMDLLVRTMWGCSSPPSMLDVVNGPIMLAGKDDFRAFGGCTDHGLGYGIIK